MINMQYRLNNFGLEAGKMNKLSSFMKDIETCKDCNLDNLSAQIKNNFLRGQGNLDSKVMFVGIAPTYYRKDGNLFTNPSNATDSIFIHGLSVHGIKREDVYVTNLSKGSSLKNRSLTDKEINHLIIHLHQEIRIIKPMLIVFMGLLFKASDMSEITSLKIPVVYIKHPSSLRYNDNDVDFSDEIAKVAEKMRELDILK